MGLTWFSTQRSATIRPPHQTLMSHFSSMVIVLSSIVLLDEELPMSLVQTVVQSLYHDRPYRTADAFAALYETAYPSIWRYIYMLHGGSAMDTEDLVADTFLRAWKYRHSFKGPHDNAVAWLITIARHVVFAQNRRVKTTPVSVAELQAVKTTEQLVLEHEQTRALLGLLQCLRPTDRELLILRYSMGWSITSIAQHFKKSPNTVSVAVKRALERARLTATTQL